MNISDFIGFIIAIFAILFLTFRQAFEKAKAKQRVQGSSPPMGELNIPRHVHVKKTTEKKHKAKMQKRQEPFLPHQEKESAVFRQMIASNSRGQPSKGKTLIHRMKSRKNMWILNEILKAPKAMRQDEF